MKLKNNSPRDYMYEKIFLKAGQELELENEKAFKSFLKQDGVTEVIDKKEVEKLKAEVKKLKADVKKPQTRKK